MNETRRMAQFVRETRYEDLPVAWIEESRIFVLDTMAAAFVGSVQPWAGAVVEMVRELGGRPEASVINQPWQTDVARAALANGTLIGSFECEPYGGAHASGTILPAALAVCQREHLDGKAFLTALALWAEVSTRIGRAAVGLERVRGFHNPGTQGPFGAALAVGKLYGFDQATLVNAMGIAGSHAAGLLEFAWEGADTKRMHLGRASQLGLESALLARKGYTGPATVLEGRFGYFNAFSLPPNMDGLLDGLGVDWAILPSPHKLYPTHATHQSVVHAIQEFKKTHRLDPSSITRVAIMGSAHMMEERHSVRQVQSVMGAQYSLPFATAVALTRDMSNPLVLNDEAVRDPVVRHLAGRVELIPVEEPGDGHSGAMSTELTLDLDGQSHILPAIAYKGSPDNPFTWEDAREKFQRYAGRVIGEKQVSALIEAVGGLADCPDMAEIARLAAAR